MPEAISMLTTAGLALWAWKRRPAAFPLTAVAAGSMLAAHGLFWTLVQPANQAMLSWDLDAVPPEWTHWRDQWEYTHAVRALLVTVALGSMVWSVLHETAQERA